MVRLKLYTDLAEIYNQLYESLFDYKRDADFLDGILKSYNIKELVDLGCGSGHLTKLLAEMGYHVIGVDLYETMLKIARKRLPNIKFEQQDMRSLNLNRQVDCIIALGRTFTHMITNDDVEQCLISVAGNLKSGGIFVFDNFDAAFFVKSFQENKEIIHELNKTDKKIKRISKNTWHLKHGVTFNWNAEYIIERQDETEKYRDKTVLRTFFREELEFFLNRAGIKLIEIFDDDAYFTMLAQKIN